MVALVLAAGSGISSVSTEIDTHTVEYVVDVRGEVPSGGLYLRYIDHNDELVTETTAPGSWRERVEVDPRITDEVRVLATLTPAARELEPTVSCAIVVDGVERVRETDTRIASCRFDLTGLAPAPAPSGELSGDGSATTVVLWTAGAVVVLAAAAAVWWRSRAPGAAPAPQPGHEPHVRFMVVSGAITLALAIGGFFVACNATPAAPPSFDLERGLP
jgi:hypothetical protein